MSKKTDGGGAGCIGIILIIIGIGLFKGCLGNDSSGPDDFDLKYVGRQRLKDQLRDPDSLQIISERIVKPGRRGGEAGYECKYRAKNGFGGYVVDEFYTE